MDIEGFVHVDGHIFSVPWRLIGRQLEVRETKDKVVIYDGPRLVAEHPRIFCFGKKHMTDPAHRPPKGVGASNAKLPTPEEAELLRAEAPLHDFAKEVKARASSRWPTVLRRLAQMPDASDHAKAPVEHFANQLVWSVGIGVARRHERPRCTTFRRFCPMALQRGPVSPKLVATTRPFSTVMRHPNPVPKVSTMAR